MTGEEAVVAPPAPLTGPAGELGVDEADHGEATVEWSTHGLGPEKRPVAVLHRPGGEQRRVGPACGSVIE